MAGSDGLTRNKAYRKRIYDHYQSIAQKSTVPVTPSDLKPRAAMFRRIIKKHFSEELNASILDLGCGHGAFIFFMKEAGYTNIVGVDASPEQVANAARLHIPEVVEGDLMDHLSQISAETQDLVVAFDVVEHFDKEELLEFVDQVYRVLKPGGKWIIHTPNGGSPFGGAIFFGDYTHEQAFTPQSISQLLKSSGFKNVECEGDVPVSHGLKSGIRLFLWLLIRMVLRLYFIVETGAGGRELIFSQNFLSIAVK